MWCGTEAEVVVFGTLLVEKQEMIYMRSLTGFVLNMVLFDPRNQRHVGICYCYQGVLASILPMKLHIVFVVDWT